MSIAKIFVYGTIGVIVVPLGLLWLVAGGISLLNLQGEMAGARSDYLSNLLWATGLATMFLTPMIMFVRTPRRRRL